LLRAKNWLKWHAIFSTGLWPSPQHQAATSSYHSVTQRPMNVSGWLYWLSVHLINCRKYLNTEICQKVWYALLYHKGTGVILLAFALKLRVAWSTWDKDGPLGDAGVAGSGCMALWWWVKAFSIYIDYVHSPFCLDFVEKTLLYWI